MKGSLPELHAVVGVRFRGEQTLYVKRSDQMENYPGVWSLLSIQFLPAELTDVEDLAKVQVLMERLSKQRLGDVPIRTLRYLTSGDSSHNTFEKHVYLHLYEVDFDERDVDLNPQYYVDSAWLDPRQYQALSAGAACGLCLRLWSDHAFAMGISPQPFLPETDS